jgi:hypothetical protein
MSTPATHVWRPSSARTIVLDSFIPVPRGTTAVAPPPATWAAKDPGDILDYEFDISPAVVGNCADGIATLDIAINPNNPGDLTLSSATADGSLALMWFAGGQAGTIYTVTITISTFSGRSVNRSVLLPCVALATPPIPTDALVTSAGTVLTDQNGNPIILGD